MSAGMAGHISLRGRPRTYAAVGLPMNTRPEPDGRTRVVMCQDVVEEMIGGRALGTIQVGDILVFGPDSLFVIDEWDYDVVRRWMNFIVRPVPIGSVMAGHSQPAMAGQDPLPTGTMFFDCTGIVRQADRSDTTNDVHFTFESHRLFNRFGSRIPRAGDTLRIGTHDFPVVSVQDDGQLERHYIQCRVPAMAGHVSSPMAGHAPSGARAPTEKKAGPVDPMKPKRIMDLG